MDDGEPSVQQMPNLLQGLWQLLAATGLPLPLVPHRGTCRMSSHDNVRMQHGPPCSVHPAGTAFLWSATATPHFPMGCFLISHFPSHLFCTTDNFLIFPPSFPPTPAFPGGLSKNYENNPKPTAGLLSDGNALSANVPANTSPIVVLVNFKSGNNDGVKFARMFKRLLNPLQIFDLTQGGPSPGLSLLKSCDSFRVVGCGGDGTIGWILQEADKLGIRHVRLVLA